MSKQDNLSAIKSQIISMPVLRKYLNNDNFDIVIADDKRKEIAKRFGGGGMLETWFADDEGVGEYTHPNLGKNVIEIYDDIPTDQLGGYVYRDALHIIADKDPKMKLLKKMFANSFTPEENKYLRKQFLDKRGSNAVGNDYKEWLDRSVVDGYIRGGLGEPSEYGDIYNSGDTKVYSPTQRKIIDRIKIYLETEK